MLSFLHKSINEPYIQFHLPTAGHCLLIVIILFYFQYPVSLSSQFGIFQ